MKQLIRRLARVSDSLPYEPLSEGKQRRRRRQVPEGHVPVYVGPEMERFVVRAELLSRPVFVELLTRSAQEYGYEQVGGLRIPCSVPVFERVLRFLLVEVGGRRELAVAGEEEEDLIRSFDQEL